MGNIEKNMGKERERDTNVLKTFIAVCEYNFTLRIVKAQEELDDNA